MLFLLQQLLTNIAANSGRLSDINKLADDILKRGTSQKDQVIKRQKEINDRYIACVYLSNIQNIYLICFIFFL